MALLVALRVELREILEDARHQIQLYRAEDGSNSLNVSLEFEIWKGHVPFPRSSPPLTMRPSAIESRPALAPDPYVFPPRQIDLLAQVQHQTRRDVAQGAANSRTLQDFASLFGPSRAKPAQTRADLFLSPSVASQHMVAWASEPTRVYVAASSNAIWSFLCDRTPSHP